MSEDDRPDRVGGFVVAVDGGAATGKTTVCSALSLDLRVPYFNGGLLYRALAWFCLKNGVSPQDEAHVEHLVHELGFEVSFNNYMTSDALDGVALDLTDLKVAAVSRAVPTFARQSAVRSSLLALQRRVVKETCGTVGGIVIDGRDVTSIVVPNADVKILLTSSAESKDMRRADCEPVGASLKRDIEDAKHSNFMTETPGVKAIDTSALNLESVIHTVVSYSRSELGLPTAYE